MSESNGGFANWMTNRKQTEAVGNEAAADVADPAGESLREEELESLLNSSVAGDEAIDADMLLSDSDDVSASDDGACEQPPRIAGRGVPAGIAARTGDGGDLHTEPVAEATVENTSDGDDLAEQVNSVLDRVSHLVEDRSDHFEPRAPKSIAATGLTAEEIEKLILKFMSARGSATGREVAQQVCLPYGIIESVIKRLRAEMLVTLKGAAEAGDYEFVLTDSGRSLAAEHVRDSSYFGAAPVCLKDYLEAMAAQSVARQEVSVDDLQRAFDDLVINRKMLNRLGPAINSGRGMFLFGEAGNGKTSIAERVTSAFGSSIWIPRALGIDGEIVRVFDPGIHKEIKAEDSGSLLIEGDIDRRWVHIERPTVVVGGELTMDDLEVTQNPTTRICEAPVQLKSNCGTLVIDDFGRQRMPVDELLNRWIVPLEKRYDFLNLPSGKKIQVPFDQLIIFSTNLEPKDLVDGAFLRRIPYKIQVPDPSRDEFIQIFGILAPLMGFEFKVDVVERLIERHFIPNGRPFRSCQPRDLLLQVRNYCTYHRLPRTMTDESFDFAVENYFSIL
ncbi:MAG: AAA family ATPase [Planctomycetota bacterium]|jgi:hypothetical protein